MQNSHKLQLKKLGIDTYKESVIYIRADSSICISEGFSVPTRIRVSIGKKSILATLNTIEGDLLSHEEVSLSNYAWQLLDAKEGDMVSLCHQRPLQSLSFIRSKIYGHALTENEISSIINDVIHGRYSDIHIASFLTACSGNNLSKKEIINLTKAMVNVGERLTWSSNFIVDKHCIGGLPGNRTTLIIVPIVTAFGLTMPKTSSRAITSPAGTADCMETLAPVDLDIPKMRKVVEQEGGCIAWGGKVNLSPADEILIRVERAIELDFSGQMIASVLSKKISAGSSHIVIDIPVGLTAKVRNIETAHMLENLFAHVGEALGLTIKTQISDGLQPVGRGIGPALEAKDALAVLQNHDNAPKDLRDRALTIAGSILEFSNKVHPGEGKGIAETIVNEGIAWKKFQSICDAQGGMRCLTTAQFTQVIEAKKSGTVARIDNRQLARLAKLAGAPYAKAAGIVLHAPLDTIVFPGQPLFTIHAETKGQLNYALSMLEQFPNIIQLDTY